MNPTLTVLIPVLNGMPYLPETLASLEAQTFRDFQVVVWDNGSTDGTVEAAREFIPSRLAGRVVSDRPLPLHESLATMVEEAETEWIARMDADDVCHKERFAAQVEYLEGNPDLVLLGTQIEWINEDGELIEESDRLPVNFHEILACMLFRNPLSHPTVIFRRTAVIQVGNYSRCKPVEDYDLWMRLAMVGRIENLPDKLLKYRRHPGAVTAEGIDSGKRVLHAAMIDAVASHSLVLFGIDVKTYLLLRAKKHPHACFPILRIASKLAARSDVSLWRFLTSPSSIYTFRCLTADHDYLSKGIWRLLSLFGKTHLESGTRNMP